MSGEGVTSHVIAGVALNRAVRGEPLRIALGVPTDAPDRRQAPFEIRTAADERVAIIAYLHGLADDMIRRSADDCSDMDIRSAAQAIENGEHWQ